MTRQEKLERLDAERNNLIARMVRNTKRHQSNQALLGRLIATTAQKIRLELRMEKSA